MDISSVGSALTYGTFLEQAYHAIRAQAPHVAQVDRMQPWLLSIGEILLRMPPELQREWAEQYTVLLIVKYGHLAPDVARVCIRHGLKEAEASWPTVPGHGKGMVR